MLIKITENDVFKDNPELSVIPELKSLKSNELKFIALVYDYESIYRQHPMEDRKLRAAKALKMTTKDGTYTTEGKKLAELHTKKYQTAVEAYQEMQFDADKESLQAYDEQMKQYRDFLSKKDKDSDELSLAPKIQTALIAASKQRRELLDALGVRVEDDDKEESDLSAIELYRKQKDAEDERRYN
jgi:hypothetical protein